MPYKHSKYHRYRQINPNKCVKGTIKNVPISHAKYRGRKFRKKNARAIVCKLKSSKKWVPQSFLIKKN